MLEW